jgi:hypothetical protein
MARDAYFTEAHFDSIFTPAARHYTRYRSFDFPEHTGAILGLPFAVGSHFLLFDSLILDQWGVPHPSMHPTFDELLSIITATTGTNPVTGRQNYGTFIASRWLEWLGISADIYRSLSLPSMSINDLDVATYIDYIANDPNILRYFEILLTMIENAPAAAAAGAGHEHWLTPDNNIAILMDTPRASAWYNHWIAGDTEVTERFLPIFLPVGQMGVSGFPEVPHIAVSRLANNPDLAWEVVKTICTDIDILNLVLENFEVGRVPALLDYSGIRIMNDPFINARYYERLERTFMTDDYWFWRDPIQRIFGGLFVGDFTAEEARAAWHDHAVTWVETKKLQLG